jgi:hypothetical protein
MAGHNLLQETQALSTNLKDLGTGMKSGKFKSDMSDSELDWMDEFTKQLEEYISSLNKKANAKPSSASKPTLSPSVKSASPSAGSTLMDKFFPEESVEYAKTQAFEYKAPSDGDASTRHAAKFDSLLRDNATKNDYREWRLMSQAFVDTQAQLKILESSVRDSLLSSLGASTRQAVLAQFGSKLSSKKVADLIHYLDMRYSFMASVEDTNIIEEFEQCKRSTNMTLASFLATWKSSLTRASIAGYVPSSDVSNLLSLARNDYGCADCEGSRRLAIRRSCRWSQTPRRSSPSRRLRFIAQSSSSGRTGKTSAADRERTVIRQSQRQYRSGGYGRQETQETRTRPQDSSQHGFG